ncbi:MAG TPA: permease, partial [Herpetosiphonaceae bacterium]
MTVLSPAQIRWQTVQRRLRLLFVPLISILGLWLASGFLVPASLQVRSAQLQGLVTTFLGIFIEALPFLLAGVIVSSLIAQFITPAHIARWVPRNVVVATLMGSLLGLTFPVCECGAIPTSRRLVRKGAPPAMGLAFAMAAPVVNPIVLISTTVAFADWRWAAARVGFTIVIAVLIGLILGAGIPPAQVLAPAALAHDTAPHDHGPACDHDHGHDHRHESPQDRSWLRALVTHGSGELFEMAQYLVIGALLAALMQTFVPQQALVALNGSALGVTAPLVAILLLMGVAVLLSVCSTVDSFLALAFLGIFHPGAIMAFLIFGPMIDIKSTLMLTSTFRKPAVAA